MRRSLHEERGLKSNDIINHFLVSGRSSYEERGLEPFDAVQKNFVFGHFS